MFEQAISKERIRIDFEATSFADALEELVHMLPPELDAQFILQSILAREMLGNTGIGNKVAIPHVRVENIGSPIICCLRLAQEVLPIGEEINGVNLIFLIVSDAGIPSQHLQMLAQIARVVQQENIADQLQTVDSAAAFYELLIESTRSSSNSK